LFFGPKVMRLSKNPGKITKGASKRRFFLYVLASEVDPVSAGASAIGLNGRPNPEGDPKPATF
jgi:hypothetical protein